MEKIKSVEKVSAYKWIDKHFLKKQGVSKNYQPEWEAFQYKLKDKLVAYSADYKGRPIITLKGDPFQNEILRQKYHDITAGYHMNKDWWNTVYLDGKVPESVVKEMIDVSYGLILKGFSKKLQKEITGA
jgi:predicted DNA-binding protein (MmcQ/YjbR family)